MANNRLPGPRLPALLPAHLRHPRRPALLILVQGIAQAPPPPPRRERVETARAATLIERARRAIATVKAFNAAPCTSPTRARPSRRSTARRSPLIKFGAQAQVIVRDGDDARNLIAVVWTQGLVVVTMLGVGLIWALVRGWQLTLAGFAIAPVFAVVMAVQTKLVARCEVRNKRARESVARAYYETLINVRGIRSMGFERVFREEFDKSAERALRTGVRGAFVEGCTYGIASGLIYLAEALLFYVGAVLIARGTYSYLQMVEVLNLVFSVSIGSQLMAFTERIAKAVQATADFNRLLNLDTKTQESQGKLCPDLTNDTDITFNHVDFAYPENPSVPSRTLYEPTYGNIELGSNRLGDIDVHHLREHVSVVSQQPNLFDATIAENATALDRTSKIPTGSTTLLSAAPRSRLTYNTMVGENAALISGGQAQRLQIARALVRPARVLILDECTSALDAENQAAVLETIAGIAARSRKGSRRTTVMVTHKLQVMRMCDRIVVLQDGEVREQGTYEELLERKGVFATLASAASGLEKRNDNE
ncbi:hypothetical protein D9619_013760 [Psilocybe cf. subviscida]|uniref:ABC transmembrane type-1 domain-containing protein n=1 Tax=Psilocybe cf. subviscida TaxID=2480587 RepID=A0A8H5F496_9AGAR|nr:hypothetical protein D9619_013760 [Psilocybe cf. subviscida]